MILKEKEFNHPSDAKLRAGEEAEKQMAFYLQREFRKDDDCFVINDLRVIHDGDVAQIDHLIVSVVGLFIIESKSAHVISIDQHGGWQRTYNNQVTGMASPVLQAEAQGEILKELLIGNKEKLRGKAFFGKMQKGFTHCPVNVYVAISDNGIIQREINIPQLFKADAVAKAVVEKMADLKSKVNLLAPQNFFSREIVWDMTSQEARAVAEFLVSIHTPAVTHKPESALLANNSNTDSSFTDHQADKTFVPRVGALCPKCGQRKLIRRSTPRSDGTETDFLACEGYPSECKGLFPLVAIIPKPLADSVVKEKLVKAINHAEGDLCPQCKIGTLKKRKAKTEFLGCSNFPKCKFTDYR